MVVPSMMLEAGERPTSVVSTCGLLVDTHHSEGTAISATPAGKMHTGIVVAIVFLFLLVLLGRVFR